MFKRQRQVLSPQKPPEADTAHPGHPSRDWPPRTRGHLMEALGASGSASIWSVSSRQTETQAAEIRQLPFLAVRGLIKKPRAARLQAPSTDLRDLLIAWLSPKDTAERRLYLPLIRPASLRSSPNRLLPARLHHPTLTSPSATHGASMGHRGLGEVCAPRELPASQARWHHHQHMANTY